MFTINHLILIIAWLSYAAIHSLLASLPIKHWATQHIPSIMAWYRLAFNTFAALLLIPVFYCWNQAEGPLLWAWTGPAAWVADGIALLAIISFLVSTRYYDTAEFMGFRQWRERNHSVEDQETFQVSPFHRFVRHPWYSFAIVIIWTRDMDLASLISMSIITLYFALGSRLEERKLVQYHGEVYRRYQQAVPGLLPRPWRYLTKRQAEELSG